MRILSSLRSGFKTLAMAALVVAGIGATSPAAQALSLNWTLSGPGTTVGTNIANTGVGSYMASGVGNTPQNWSLSTTALETRTYYFDWVFQGFHGLSDVTASLASSTGTALVSDGPSNIGTLPAGGFVYAGTRLTWNATVGDTLFFNFGGSNADAGATNVLAGTLTVTSVPLPAPLLTLIAGLAGLALFARRRTKAATAA